MIGAFLVDTFKGGNLSSRDLREGARAAGSSAGDLTRLATKGLDKTRTRKGKTKPDTRGDSRAVMRALLSKKEALPEPYKLDDVPLWDHAKNAQYMATVKVYPPHESLDTLVAPGEEDTWASFDDSQHKFGNHLHEWANRVGVVLHGRWLCLSLWGDSAPYSKKDSLYLLTYRVLNGTHRRRVWIAALGKRSLCACGCYGRHTIDAIFDVVVWSMKVLLSGVWPSHDHRGRPFSKGDWRRGKAGQDMRFRGALLAKCGDWAWHKQVLGVRGWRERQLCWKCQATLRDRDFSSNASWRQSSVCNSAFLASAYNGRQYLSSLFGCPGFTLDYVQPDWMHTVCLGILQYFTGNIMWFCFTEVGGKMTKPQEACAMLFNMINVVASDLGLEQPIASLVVTMFRPSMNKKPKMRLKAAEGRYFLPILTVMLQRFFPWGGRR